MGSFASVFEAFDVEKNEKIAVKHFPLESKQYFFAEAALLRSCDSPFIVTIFEIYIDAQSKHYCLAMELCGGSIRSKVGNCPSSDLLHIANDVLSALVYLHRRQIIHRDVKPYNILLSRSGNYKLAGSRLEKMPVRVWPRHSLELPITWRPKYITTCTQMLCITMNLSTSLRLARHSTLSLLELV